MEDEASAAIEGFLKKNKIEDQIDLFEQNWKEWDTNACIEWFKYVLNCKNSNNDYRIENLDDETQTQSETESESEDSNNNAFEEEKKSENSNINKLQKFNEIGLNSVLLLDFEAIKT